MLRSRTCINCGKPLPEQLPDDTCPACIFRDVLGLSSDAEIDESCDAFSPAPGPSGIEPLAGGTMGGERFGEYELLREIGRGGMGVVWQARQTRLNRMVAVKRIAAGALANPDAQKRFQSEAQAVASLQHPHIVTIHEIGEIAGQHFFSMEYVPGGSFAELVRIGPCTARQAAGHVEVIAGAIHYAHGRGILHRDLKSSNVLLDASGAPKLTDFGLAKNLLKDSDVTLSGQIMGSPGFMSPEQAAGRHRELSPRTDVYGLGAILYHLLTGRPPFVAETVEQMFAQVMFNEPLAPRVLVASVPRDLETIALKCLEKDPARRYASAAELAEELHRFLIGAPIRARPVGRAERTWRWCCRNQALAAAIVGIAALLAGGGALFRAQRISADAAARGAGEKATYFGSLLSHARSLRADPRADGWSKQVWDACVTAAEIGTGQSIVGDATASMAGLDAQPRLMLAQSSASSLAFAADGALLTGGSGASNAVLIVGRNGQVETLRSSGDGPVLWGADNVPMRLFADRDGFELREVRMEKVLQRFALFPGEQVSNNDGHLVLAVSADGRRVAACVGDPPSRRSRSVVWDVGSGEVLGETNLAATALGLSPDGQRCAIGDQEGNTTVFSIPGMRFIQTLHTPVRRGPVLALGFARDRLVPFSDLQSGDRWLLAVGDQGGGLVIWDVLRNSPRSFCGGSLDTVLSVAFHPDGLTLASAGKEDIKLWDVSTGRMLLRVTGGGTDPTRALAFNPMGDQLAAGSRQEFSPAKVCVWDLTSDRGIAVLRGLTANVRVVWISPDSQKVAAVANDWRVGIWDIPTRRLLWLFEVPIGESVDNAGGAFNAKGDRFAFASGTEARLYDLNSGRVAGRWTLRDGLADQLQFDARARLILLRREAGLGRTRPSVWRLYHLADATDSVVLHEQSDTSWRTFMTLLPARAEKFIVMNGGSGPNELQRVLKIFNTETGQELKTFATERRRGDLLNSLDPTGRWLCFSTNNESRAMLVSLSNLEPVRALQFCPSLDPTGELYAWKGERGFALSRSTFNPDSADEISGDRHAILGATFSPDGRSLAWGTAEGEVLVMDVAAVSRKLSAFPGPNFAPKNGADSATKSSPLRSKEFESLGK